LIRRPKGVTFSRLYWSVGKVLLVVIAAPLVLAALLVSAFFLINLRDATLNPQAGAALGAHHDAVPARDNLFFAVLAFDVRNSGDINADGQRLYENYLAGFKKAAAAPLTLAKDPSFVRQALVGDANQLCNVRKTGDCIERAAANPAGMQALLRQNALLLDRYRSLQSYRRFENRLHPSSDSAVIDWAPFLTAKRLFLASIALDVARNQTAAGLAQLRADTSFTRRVMAEPDILLIDKVILATSLSGNLLLAAEILRHGPLTDSDNAALRDISAPLVPEELSLAGPLEREYEILSTALLPLGDARSGSRFVSALGQTEIRPALEGKAAQHFFKLNATLNDAWSANRKAIQMSETSCQQWREAATAQKPIESRFPLVSYAYNPIGKLLIRAFSPAYGSMTAIFCDLQAMQRIVALQTAIRSEASNTTDIGSLIARSAPEFADPYTGRPFHWDAASRAVTFAVAAERDKGVVPWPF
jgi:hypothetical protein